MVLKHQVLGTDSRCCEFPVWSKACHCLVASKHPRCLTDNCVFFPVGRTARPCHNLSACRRQAMDSVSDVYLRSNLSSQVPLREPVFCLVEKRWMGGWKSLSNTVCYQMGLRSLLQRQFGVCVCLNWMPWQL